ncbi:uncharacterized protein LOC144139368 [Haemaphysalis longicornis]
MPVLLLSAILVVAFVAALLLVTQSSILLAERDMLPSNSSEGERQPVATGSGRDLISSPSEEDDDVIRHRMDTGHHGVTQDTDHHGTTSGEVKEAATRNVTKGPTPTTTWTTTTDGSRELFIRRSMCGDYYFGLCPATKEEFYFDASERACKSAADNVDVAVCNLGTNRFRTEASCVKSCGRRKSTYDRKCTESVLFTQCMPDDVIGGRWFFSGARCKAWTFPRGLCPTNDSVTFYTYHTCSRKCFKVDSGPAPCAVPRVASCAGGRLKYPYFANMSATNSTDRCVRVLPRNIMRYRCLVGNNRFRSLEECRKMCVL